MTTANLIHNGLSKPTLYPADDKVCHRCGNRVTVHLHYDIKANHTKQYYWFCDLCQRMTPSGIFMPHERAEAMIARLRPEQQEHFWRNRLRNDYRSPEPCAVSGCSNTDVEMHHIAPESLRDYFAGDWEKFPVVYLCRKHHAMWHRAVTWYLPGCGEHRDELLNRFLRNGGAS